MIIEMIIRICKTLYIIFCYFIVSLGTCVLFALLRGEAVDVSDELVDAAGICICIYIVNFLFHPKQKADKKSV